MAAATSFEFRLARTAWFGETVLWLAPEPAAPFKHLTELLCGEFPTCPPFGGQFAEVVPHLTIGDHGTLHQLREAEREVQQHLPITAIARGVSLMIERLTGDGSARWPSRSPLPADNATKSAATAGQS